MDEMRIVSKFTRGIISKAIKMVIRKKTGYNIDIQLNEAITTVNDGKTHLHLDVDSVRVQEGQEIKEKVFQLIKEDIASVIVLYQKIGGKSK